MLIPTFSVGAAWTPDTRAEELAADVRAALDIWLSELTPPRGWAYAASLMGDMKLPELSAWLACRKPMNIFRFAQLPDEFHNHLTAIRAKRLGGLFLSADVVLLLKGAAVLRRSLVRARLPEAARKVERA